MCLNNFTEKDIFLSQLLLLNQNISNIKDGGDASLGFSFCPTSKSGTSLLLRKTARRFLLQVCAQEYLQTRATLVLNKLSRGTARHLTI